MTPALVTRPLTAADWPVIEDLFGAKGACGGCWCMYWRLSGPDFKSGKGEGNKAAFRALVESGYATGILAFADEKAVGWCAIGPRERYLRIVSGRALRRDAPEGTWSLNCFYVPAEHRGQGVAQVLIDAATTWALGHGARGIEGYPVTPKGQKMAAAFAYTGVDAMFAHAGYAKLDRDGRAIWVRTAA